MVQLLTVDWLMFGIGEIMCFDLHCDILCMSIYFALDPVNTEYEFSHPPYKLLSQGTQFSDTLLNQHADSSMG